MVKRVVPVEIAGFKNQNCWVRNVVTGESAWRWMSVRNDNYDDNDFESWNGESGFDDCPF
jgi:hypothetical protein